MTSPECSESAIHARLTDYHGRTMIRLEFKYDTAIIAEIKSIRGRVWSVTHKCWYVPDTPQTRERFGISLNMVRDEAGRITGGMDSAGYQSTNLTAFEKLPEAIKEKLREFRKWMEQHRYSEQTIRNYLNHLSQFFVYLGDIDIREVTTNDVIRFNHDVIIKLKLSISYQRVVTGAIKLFYSHFFDHKLDATRLDRPFREKRLPMVLSKEEVGRIIKATANLKHRTMLSTIYSCGLRRGEMLSLKIVDLDRDRNLIRIVQGKGFTP